VIIVMICNRIPPAIDGVGDYTYRLAIALAKAGHSVHLICREQETAQHPAGIQVHPVVKKWRAAASGTLSRLIREIQPDWVGLHYVPYAFHPFGLPCALPGLLRGIRQAGIPVWVTFHEVHIRLKGFRDSLIGFAQRRIACNLCRTADKCITSIEFYRQLLEPFHSDLQVIPVGANIEPGNLPDADRRRLRQQLFPGMDYVVSTFGNRNHAALIQCIENLNAHGIKAGLLIVGFNAGKNDPADRPWMVHTGYLPGEKVGHYLQCSDLFVLPDYVGPNSEGGTCTKSGSLAAAFATGLPVIGIRGDMNNALLRHGENIWLAASGSPHDLGAAISTLLANKSLHDRLKAGGNALFAGHLSWQAVSRAYEQFFHRTHPI